MPTLAFYFADIPVSGHFCSCFQLPVSFIGIIFVRGWEFYICNSGFFFLLGFRQPTAVFLHIYCTSNESSPRSGPRMFPEDGGEGSLWDFSLCSVKSLKGITFCRGVVVRESSEPKPFQIRSPLTFFLFLSTECLGVKCTS